MQPTQIAPKSSVQILAASLAVQLSLVALLVLVCLAPAGDAIATINIWKHRYPFYGGYGGYYPFWGGYGGYGGIGIGGFGGGYGRR